MVDVVVTGVRIRHLPPIETTAHSGRLFESARIRWGMELGKHVSSKGMVHCSITKEGERQLWTKKKLLLFKSHLTSLQALVPSYLQLG